MTSDPSPIPSWKTDWSCLCQEDTKEDLKCPPTRYTLEQNGYKMIGENIPLFHQINEMPIKFDPARLDEGNGIEETLKKNNAKYHLSCRKLFNQTKLDRATKRSAKSTEAESSSKARRVSIDHKLYVCFICEKEALSSDLHQAMTMKLNNRLNQCAKNLCDKRLLTILGGGDVVAQELKYHAACLADLYNKEAAFLSKSNRDVDEYDAYPRVFSELLAYITETKLNSDGPKVFRLAELADLYKKRLEQLGVEHPKVNSTRLKEKILEHIPDLQAQKEGFNKIVLAFQDDVGSAVTNCAYTDAIILSKAAKILRKDMLNHKIPDNETYNMDSIDESIPSSLLNFIGLIEHGIDIKSQIGSGASKTSLAMAQLLQFNCFAKSKRATTQRHSKDRETPLPVYIGLSVYARTRMKNLVEILFHNGLSISYDRVLEITAELGDAAVSKYTRKGVVCPPEQRKGLFTTLAMDNIDHNPSSTTSTTSFHGTSISLFQYPTDENEGEQPEKLKIRGIKEKKVPELPEYYMNVKPAHLTNKTPCPPKITDMTLPESTILQPQLSFEYEWLQDVSIAEFHENINITWSSHHAEKKRGPSFKTCISSMLPLLRDEANSVATICHVMDRIRDTVRSLNPGQVPVITAD